MRPPTIITPARSISRICLRCRLQAGPSSPRPSLSSRTTAAPSLSPSRNPLIQAHQRAAPFSHTARALSAASSNKDDNSSNRHQSSSSSRPSAPRTHYDIFPQTLADGPPPAGHFPIDTRALRREFLQLQARAHPDLHPAESKTRAAATSSLINEAYRTLANPLLRAQYLLSLRGVDVANDETLKVEEPDLLMLVLEAREEIEEAQTEDDLERPRRENDERIRESEQRLDRAFAEDDVEAAKREAVRLRYWVNIRESLDNWEPGKPVVLEH
ncbi:J-type co-chaperone-like protein [Hapsidospora chrysogenum ATCC 11550]|uniref:J-type co-chaperone-like protein n=1 Tax=Hapsidospora chrysogenum (strain ATCC 11550 / CBS 779.69 / DSM 880 / IAM 14645 / JCM 23072 / IMI 49137) TaxID=857340 RepID=A0A086T6J7_HAPC1|nr:J-type co-chaperone-like protein [Hapsidospora chrysogenum ATCC 11550]